MPRGGGGGEGTCSLHNEEVTRRSGVFLEVEDLQPRYFFWVKRR